MDGILVNSVTDSEDLLDEVRNLRTRDKIQHMQQQEEVGNNSGHTNHNNNDEYRALVCVVCDRFIIGNEPNNPISMENILRNKHRLSVSSYERHHKRILPVDLITQYEVEDHRLMGILLSPRARCIDEKYDCCQQCRESMKNVRSDNPPKFAIANGFAIGSIPSVLNFIDSELRFRQRVLDIDEDIDEIIAAAVSPVRPFGYVFAFNGGSQKSIKGHFSLFSVNQSHVGGVVNTFNNTGANPNIYVVLCGRMTPTQKALVRRKARMNTSIFTDLLQWFIRKSGHPGYNGITPPDEYGNPVYVVADNDSDGNTDHEVDADIESRFDGVTYYFSSKEQEPDQHNSVFDNNSDFASAMLNGEPPTLLMYGGNYVGAHEINLIDLFPIQFPFGIGGPTTEDRRVPVSHELCLSHYMRLSLKQFMKGDFILVCYHILCRMLSYRSGLIKCKSSLNGEILGEKIASLKVSDIEEAASYLDRNNNDDHSASYYDRSHLAGSPNNAATSFLRSVKLSCKVVGHTKEAAMHARRNIRALNDRFGLHSIFFTITPDDECTYRIRIYANAGKSIKVPGVACSDDECITDFHLRRKTRLDYPGACSLEFQSVIQLVLVLLGWDPKNQCGKKGIFGILLAFCLAVEEQGRGTLHGHWLLWIKLFSKLRRLLFHHNTQVREAAQTEIVKYIDNIIHSSYGNDFEVFHPDTGEKGNPDEIFEDSIDPVDLQRIRDCRHKNKCQSLKGEILLNKQSRNSTDNFQSSRKISTVECIYSALDLINRNSDIPFQDLSFPLSQAKLDLLAYRYCMDSSCYDDHGNIWMNKKARQLMLKLRFDQHDYKHRPSCFKKSRECRFNRPILAKANTEILIDESEDKTINWKTIRGYEHTVKPYSFVTTRNQGSQFLNDTNDHISRIFCCNCNVQAGDNGHMYYTSTYSSKNTQTEDRVGFDIIAKQCIIRLQRERNRVQQENQGQLQNANQLDSTNHQEAVSANQGFREGLKSFLCGMATHMKNDIISAPMAHYLICNNGSRFKYSHSFQELMVSQMINFIDGKPLGDFVLRRRNRGEDNEVFMWPDHSINDYIYRSEELQELCFYQFTSKYEKRYLTFKQMSTFNENGLPLLKEGEMLFCDGHPARKFCCIKKKEFPVIPRMSIPSGYLCNTKELDLSNERPQPHVIERREFYAKAVLAMFYPFRSVQDLIIQHETTNAPMWEKLNSVIDSNQLWIGAYSILDNIQEIMVAEQCKRGADPLHSVTNVPSPDQHDQSPLARSDQYNDEDSDFDNKDIIDQEEFEREITRIREESADLTPTEHSLDILARRANVLENHIIGSRLLQTCEDDSFILLQDDTENSERSNQDEETIHSRQFHTTNSSQTNYDTILAFVSTAIHQQSNVNHDELYAFDGSHGDYDNGDLDFADMNLGANMWRRENINNIYDNHIPTLREVARRVAREENIKLDKDQYKAYTIIAASFLIDILSGVKSSQVRNSQLNFSGVDETEEISDEEERVKFIMKELQDFGGKKQLIMFMTGPAGAGKSTAIKVAQKFCKEFCRCGDLQWSDKSFYFTAMTGSAASLFGGVTLHSAAFLNKKTKITSDEKAEWDDVRILIIDEISFCSVQDMNKLNENLNFIKRESTHETNTMYGGLSIIFCGDFHQMLPVKTKIEDCLFARNGFWENSIDVVIVLDNSHRFKDDPEYGEILRRIWDGTFSREDCDRINTRWVSPLNPDSPTLPQNFQEDDDICYACPENKHRVSIHSRIFQKHIKNFPGVNEDNGSLPPKHTVIIEATFRTRKHKTRVNSLISGMKISQTVSDEVIKLCGDTDLRDNNTKVDPALKLYIGAHCMCTTNEDVKGGIANGTIGVVKKIVLKGGTTLCWKNWSGKKVYTTTAEKIKYVELEKSGSTLGKRNNNKIKLKPKHFSCFVSTNILSDPSHKKQILPVSVYQLPMNVNDATTGHKLQGMSKRKLIVQSWCKKTKNWAYTVLSRVRSLDGLYLMTPLEFNPSYFEIPKELKHFEERMKHKIPK